MALLFRVPPISDDYPLASAVVEGPSVVDLIQENAIDVVINTPRGRSARADGYEIRTATVAADKALFTTIAQVGAAVASLEQRPEKTEVTSLQDYQRRRDERAR